MAPLWPTIRSPSLTNQIPGRCADPGRGLQEHPLEPWNDGFQGSIGKRIPLELDERRFKRRCVRDDLRRALGHCRPLHSRRGRLGRGGHVGQPGQQLRRKRAHVRVIEHQRSAWKPDLLLQPSDQFRHHQRVDAELVEAAIERHAFHVLEAHRPGDLLAQQRRERGGTLLGRGRDEALDPGCALRGCVSLRRRETRRLMSPTKGLGRLASYTGRNASQSMSATTAVGRSSPATASSARSAWTGSSPRLPTRSNWASDSAVAMPPPAQGPHWTESAGRPCCCRRCASPSRNALAALYAARA